MKPLNNYVEIEVPQGVKPVEIDGQEFLIDNSYDPGKYVISYGEVVGIPYGINLAEWTTRMNVLPGDKVWFQKYEAIKALGSIADPTLADYEENTAYYIHQGRIRVFIPYDALFFVERNKETIMLNGYALIEPVEKSIQSVLEITDDMKGDEVHIGKVYKIGEPNTGYDYNGYTDSSSYQIGDHVFFTKYQNDAQFDYLNKKLYKIQRRFIIGKFDLNN